MISAIDAAAMQSLLYKEGQKFYPEYREKARESAIPDNWQALVDLPDGLLPTEWSAELDRHFPWCTVESQRNYVLTYLRLIPILREYEKTRQSLEAIATYVRGSGLDWVSVSGSFLGSNEELENLMVKVGFPRTIINTSLDFDRPELERLSVFNRYHQAMLDDLESQTGALVYEHIGALVMYDTMAQAGCRPSFSGLKLWYLRMTGQVATFEVLRESIDMVETWFAERVSYNS
jgi:hypothetical protein